jgi:signal transduction histidine kinase
MPESKNFEKIKLRNVFIPLIIVLLSCSSLIITNYYTIKILSTARAYVNGESHYSKGQKDATRHLTTYLYTKDSAYWKLFQEEMSVPKGDGIARIGLTYNGDTKTIKNGLRAGRNHEKDLDEMIWLFKHFHTVPFLAKAINEWEKADSLIKQLTSAGDEIHKKISTANLNPEDRQKALKQINSIATKLNINEQNFSYQLGEGTRFISIYLLFINIFFILTIIGSVSIYYSLMLNRLSRSKQETEDKNKNLIIANEELDKFVYSASHDLRSPISSLKGLIEIIKLEDNPDQTMIYLDLMQQSLNKQDQFINEIIDYSRNKRQKETIAIVSLNKIIDEAIAQHLYIKGANEITIKKELSIDEIYSDDLRLKIILNNLLSNAIKYTDENKQKKYITIKAHNLGEFCKIEVEDNGLGIKKKYHASIFEMFFVTQNPNKGSGLGLYLAKKAVKNLNGNITVDSEINIGSKFTVTIPKAYGI